MFPESDLLPLSALQHLIFCERQCALIHLEGLWAENSLTIEGRHLHEKVDSDERLESRGSVRIARGVPLRSLRLGLTGKADVVEFYRADAPRAPAAPDEPSEAVALEGVPGLWRPFPVEYKRGKPKRDHCDAVQICAQALCLEEMLGAIIVAGALFYGQTRRREDVAFDAELRAETETTAARLHALFASRVTPRAIREPKCDKCSLLKLCLPEFNSRRQSAQAYLDSMFASIHEIPAKR